MYNVDRTRVGVKSGCDAVLLGIRVVDHSVFRPMSEYYQFQL